MQANGKIRLEWAQNLKAVSFSLLSMKPVIRDNGCEYRCNIIETHKDLESPLQGKEFYRFLATSLPRSDPCVLSFCSSIVFLSSMLFPQRSVLRKQLRTLELP